MQIPVHTEKRAIVSAAQTQRAHAAMMTLLSRQNDVVLT